MGTERERSAAARRRWEWVGRVLGTACLAAVVATGAACGGDGASPSGPASSVGGTPTPAAVTVVSGGGQSGTTGSALAGPFVVQVTTSTGAPVAGATVAFRVTTGSATLSPTSSVTDATGRASTTVTLGATAGAVTVTATVAGTTLSTTLGATATLPTTGTTPPAACDPATATTLAPGQATTPTGSALCVAGGPAGAEYALIPFNAATSYRTRAALTVTATGVDSALGAVLADARRDVTGNVAGARPARARDAAFEARLRAARARDLAPRVRAARSWYAARGAVAPGVRRSVIPRDVRVGDVVTLNANSNDPCTRADDRRARVEAVSSRAIVVADTSNPTGGYTAADYQSIAVTFDTLVDAVDRRNFGDPTDIDGNGHVVLFFTSAVNALTPRNADSFVGGFFDARDIFPAQDSPTLGPGCATSNVAELFYLLVPDPTGMVNGNRFSKSFVGTITIGTVAHEYEHLINASRKLYLNAQAEDFEETWLDEGLAHVAEELVFYARTHLAPRQNVDAATLRASSLVLSAFGDQGIANFDRLGLFLENPSRHSPYADDDSLETRGATWVFLRYAVDQQAATGQETVWRRLVDSPVTGLDNLRQVFDGDLPALFRDWATTLLLDDVAGAAPRYQFPSWNLRTVFSLPDVRGAYPLRTTPLTGGAPATVTLFGGSAAYLRFAVGAGKAGAVAWNAPPSTVMLTLVRLR